MERKKEFDFNITSNKNNNFSIIMKLEHNLDISINCPNKIPKISYTKSFSVEYIIKNKYFSLCENIEDISLTLSPILQDTNNISINEETNGVNLKIKLPHPKCPEIIFFFENKTKDVNESISELYGLIENLNNKISEQQKEINELKDTLKSNNVKITKYKEINNPWTENNKEYKYFYYTLKDNNYLAEKTDNGNFIYPIKTNYLLKKEKIYKIIFVLDYKSGDVDLGFGNFVDTEKANWLRTNNSVCINNIGLYINKNKVNEIKIQQSGKYEFIINMPKKNFNLIIDEVQVGEFEFNLQENICAQAAIRNKGSSVRIKTFESID